MKSLYQTVKNASVAVPPNRTLQDVLIKTMEELGELAQEVLINTGSITHKEPGKDGIVGEAVDAIITLLDIIHVYDPTITEDDLSAIASVKCDKWLNTQR